MSVDTRYIAWYTMGVNRKRVQKMARRKKPGRKPSDRIRQHVMLDPENWALLRNAADKDGRSLSDQMNWIMRHYAKFDDRFGPRQHAGQ